MPAGYNNETQLIANHKLASLAYNLEWSETQINSSVFIDYLSQCFYNHTFYAYVNQICDIFNKNNSKVPCVSSLFVSHDDQAIIMIFRGTTTQTELHQEEGMSYRQKNDMIDRSFGQSVGRSSRSTRLARYTRSTRHTWSAQSARSTQSARLTRSTRSVRSARSVGQTISPDPSSSFQIAPLTDHRRK
uniref:Uncharacterized protein n=1 Tax=Acrobeloides nanus TaxID=290746 RepID=A0A914E4Y2_9BILA